MTLLAAALRFRFCLVAAMLLLLMAANLSAAPRGKSNLELLEKSYQEQQVEFLAELEKLALYCDEKNLTEAAESIRALKVTPDWTGLHLEALPTSVQPPIPTDLPEPERYWRKQLRYHQTEHAKRLYQLARRTLTAGYPGMAYNLVRETAIHDPDHVFARKLLGFVRHGDEWVTPFAAKMLKEHHVWTEDFGWLKAADVDNYREGKRKVNGKWVSAEKEAEIRRDFRQPWEIRTDHFVIRTNHSQEKALELGRALEDFYEIFFQTFAGFFNTPEKLKELFNGAGPEAKAAVKPYQVHYYRTRQEYIDVLKKQFPQIEMTNGIYLTPTRTAYFYHDADANNEATLFHEATHQLFYESHPNPRGIGEKEHFWIIEGIACYMESFRRGAQGLSLGDPKYIRFAGARHNLLKEDYYLPFKEFSSMGMSEFQRHPQLVKNYTQASGLAYFFMHYDGGRYREALVTHLSQLYSPIDKRRLHAQGLDELTEVSAEELDREYAEFSRQIDRETAESVSNAATGAK